jgi:hypothetical protein
MLNAKRYDLLKIISISWCIHQAEYHQILSHTFYSLRLGSTPTLQTLTTGFNDAYHHTDPTCHYLLTDGVPSDASVARVAEFIKNRLHPERNRDKDRARKRG